MERSRKYDFGEYDGFLAIFNRIYIYMDTCKHASTFNVPNLRDMILSC